MYQRDDAGFGHGGGAAALVPGGGLRRSFGVAPSVEPILTGWRAAIHDLDLVVDLGSRLGTREWFRGLATCLALCAAPIAFFPDFGPIRGAAPAPMAESQWQQARALAITPLGLGADTGRRMAPTDAAAPLADTPERPSIDLVATIGQGDGFARVLERAGVAKAEAQDVARMVSGAVSLDGIRPGTRMDVTLGRRASKASARPLDHLLFRARFDLKLGVERVGGRLVLKRIPIAVDDTPLRIQGVVGSSLYRAARASGAPAGAVESYLRAIGSRMSIGRDVRSSDRFDIIVEQRRAETGEVEIGKLLYAGLDQGRRQTRLLQWTSGGSTQWYEASGVGETRGVMRQPVSGRMTSGFGMRRHPLLGYSRLHKGLDFGAAYGSPIVAATDGIVAIAGWHGGHGKYVKINHAGGMGTGYGHMSRIVARVGQRVSQGQLIGYVGSTGLSTGPHLHYEVYKNGVAINPKSISFTTTSQLAGADLARFRATLGRLLAVKPGAPAAPVAKPEASAEAKLAAKAAPKS
ncbi:M23 family metallopeptidase [Sphingomonas sp. KC8]|uniref:M23 family metallopeptidase n=1 Tax=Sphingomonas sp. KC8 TaxID=1030157 RepID=UPI000248A77B|nr:M23 family metallopeptidase [Sphingomonas sp. KC8]ARS28831.1 peptidase M23 [Sphingomonas sp. KC8]